MAENGLIEALKDKTVAAMTSGKPLAARLQMVADEVRKLDPNVAGVVDAFVGRLRAAEAGVSAPMVGDLLPNFVLPDHRGRLVSLTELLTQGPVIVAFLRGYWCPYCRITAGALSEIAARGKRSAAKIVVVTPDGRAFAEQLDQDLDGAFAILSDADNGYALSINLAIWVDPVMAERIYGASWNLAPYPLGGDWILPIPATFLVSREGRVVYRHVNPDYRVRADIDEMIAALDQLG